MLRIVALEPYYGGSHRAFLDGYRAHSRHRIEQLTMPARKWKWRMRGAALTMSRLLARRGEWPDALLATDYLDLAALCGLRPSPPPEVRRVAYFHENQLTYPLPSEEERDYQFGFTNITSCLAADRVVFNSRYHRDSFIAAARSLLDRMPDQVPDWAADELERRSDVVPVGVDLAAIDAERGRAAPRSGPLTVLWNHRWEYDKGPDAFFRVMRRLHEEGLPFRLAVVGPRFRSVPEQFEAARRALADHLVWFGYVESRRDYCRILLESDVVVSTAAQEFFGISVVEAVYAGCLPLLPDRLSYPELLPPEAHRMCLYRDERELAERLARWLSRPEEARAQDLSAAMRRFGWDRVAPQLDAVMEDVCAQGG